MNEKVESRRMKFCNKRRIENLYPEIHRKTLSFLKNLGTKSLVRALLHLGWQGSFLEEA